MKTCQTLTKAYEDETLYSVHVFGWDKWLSRGRDSVEDNEHAGNPSLGLYWRKTLIIDLHDFLLILISYHSGSFAIQAKGGNRLAPGLDYMVDALKLPNQAPRVSGESLQTCAAWRSPEGTQHLFFWTIQSLSDQSLSSNGPVVDSRYLNLVFGHTEATPFQSHQIHNRITVCAASPRFEHDPFRTILSYVTHSNLQSSSD
ncbi:hypothetical protein TNCV_1152021 [Trichonephila clavipes]|nr:hypothetical protein TNCV_1152021 [Trichonephila clavipes]